MNYIEMIESAFEIEKIKYANKRSQIMTGTQNVLQLLIDRPTKIWWWSWELVGKTNSQGGWISHRGSARASDLAIYHPELVECRKIGKFGLYRARLENIQSIKEFLQTSKKSSIT